jgi:hypothetical protein
MFVALLKLEEDIVVLTVFVGLNYWGSLDWQRKLSLYGLVKLVVVVGGLGYNGISNLGYLQKLIAYFLNELPLLNYSSLLCRLLASFFNIL